MDFKPEIERIRALATSMFDEVQDDYIRRAAITRLAEMEAFLHLACETPYPFSRSLGALNTGIADTIKAIEDRNNRPIGLPEFESEEQQDEAVSAAVRQREQVSAWLDQARITATALLVHLTMAIEEGKKPVTLKVV